MKKNKTPLVGRYDERQRIMDYYNSEQNEFVAIYGRRRVGKTYLVKTVLDEKIDFMFTGLFNTKSQQQLAFFVMELSKNIKKQRMLDYHLGWKHLICLNSISFR